MSSHADNDLDNYIIYVYFNCHVIMHEAKFAAENLNNYAKYPNSIAISGLLGPWENPPPWKTELEICRIPF